MNLRALFRDRLALRIYLVGLTQFAVVAAGFFAILAANRPTFIGPHQGHARFVAGTLTPLVNDPPALRREIDRVWSELHLAITVVDPEGRVIASSAPPDAPRCPHGGPFGPRGGCHAEPLLFPGGGRGHFEMLSPAPPPRPPPVGVPVIVLVLVVVGISSALLARALTRPLRRLSTAARAFGGGALDARAALDRKDELGDVSRAFDEMAERVTGLLRAEKELLANVSHELRTPLSRIRVALDLAAEGDAETARASIVDITEDLDELERLIADILTAARLDLADGTLGTGTPPLRRTTLAPGTLLAQAESRFRAAHPARALTVEVPDALPAISGDAVLLRRVIDNLLENARKYTERPDAPITLSAEGGPRLVITVRDQGIGITEADLPKVFRPFFRADKSRTRATGGLGLGLALAKRIVEAHGGTITLESKAGEGTTARVMLPLEEAATQARSSA